MKGSLVRRVGMAFSFYSLSEGHATWRIQPEVNQKRKRRPQGGGACLEHEPVFRIFLFWSLQKTVVESLRGERTEYRTGRMREAVPFFIKDVASRLRIADRNNPFEQLRFFVRLKLNKVPNVVGSEFCDRNFRPESDSEKLRTQASMVFQPFLRSSLQEARRALMFIFRYDALCCSRPQVIRDAAAGLPSHVAKAFEVELEDLFIQSILEVIRLHEILDIFEKGSDFLRLCRRLEPHQDGTRTLIDLGCNMLDPVVRRLPFFLI